MKFINLSISIYSQPRLKYFSMQLLINLVLVFVMSTLLLFKTQKCQLILEI